MHFAAALIPLLAFASSLVEAAPVESTTSRAPRVPYRSYQASLSSSSSAAAAAAAASSSSKQVWYLAPTSTTTSKTPSKTVTKDGQAESASSSLAAAASSASYASAIAGLPTGYLLPTSAPGNLDYKPAKLYLQSHLVKNSSTGAVVEQEYPIYTCTSGLYSSRIVDARLKGRTLRSSSLLDRFGGLPQAPCGLQWYIRNPSNPSQGSYFATDGQFTNDAGLPDDAVAITAEALKEVFGGDFPANGTTVEIGLVKDNGQLWAIGKAAQAAKASSSSSSSPSTLSTAVPTTTATSTRLPQSTSPYLPTALPPANATYKHGPVALQKYLVRDMVAKKVNSVEPSWHSCDDSPRLKYARSIGRTVRFGADAWPLPALSSFCQTSVYIRNPSNLSQGAWFAFEGGYRSEYAKTGIAIEKDALREVFGGDFAVGGQVEWYQTPAACWFGRLCTLG